MKENLERVNMWLDNCDQKASSLLALLGVAETVVCSSDFFAKINEGQEINNSNRSMAFVTNKIKAN